jgi:pSer/pThr/pTyr-binding forkhead associated (FHA) protein
MQSSLTIVTPDARQKRTIELGSDAIRIGRSSRSDIRIPTRSVSGHHLTLRCDGPKWTVTDEHSTNGTLLNGERLIPGRPRPLSGGDVIELDGVRLEFDAAHDKTLDVLSLEETGTLARQLASDLLLEASDDDLARLEVDGPDGPSVEPLEDALTRAFIGSDDACMITLSRLDAPRLIEISRVHDGFGVRPVDVTGRDELTLNARPLSVKTPLSDGDTLRAGAYTLRFYDPLESILVDLEDAPAANSDTNPPTDTQLEPPDTPLEPRPPTEPNAPEPMPAAEPPQAPAGGLTATEWTILAIAVVLMLGAAGLLLTVFDVV